MKRVCVLGASGFIGKNLMRRRWFNWVGLSRSDIDLTDQVAVSNYFKKNKNSICHNAKKGLVCTQ